MNEVKKKIDQLRAAIDLVGRYPKHSVIKKLPDPRHQNENTIPVAAAAVAVSALQDPVLDYASKFNTIYNKINILLPNMSHNGVGNPPSTNEKLEKNIQETVAAAAVATTTVSSSKSSSSPSHYESIFDNIYQKIKIKLAPNTAQDNLSSGDKRNNGFTQRLLHNFSLHEQLYLYTKLLANCIYISDYDIKTLLNDIITESSQSSQSRYKNEIFSYDKSKHELADKIGEHIINFFK